MLHYCLFLYVVRTDQAVSPPTKLYSAYCFNVINIKVKCVFVIWYPCPIPKAVLTVLEFIHNINYCVFWNCFNPSISSIGRFPYSFHITFYYAFNNSSPPKGYRNTALILQCVKSKAVIICYLCDEPSTFLSILSSTLRFSHIRASSMCVSAQAFSRQENSPL